MFVARLVLHAASTMRHQVAHQKLFDLLDVSADISCEVSDLCLFAKRTFDQVISKIGKVSVKDVGRPHEWDQSSCSIWYEP